MRAMAELQAGAKLIMQERPTPKPGHGELLIRTAACGVWRTDLHVVVGEFPAVPLPGGRVVCGGLPMSDIPAFANRSCDWGGRLFRLPI